MHPSYLSLYIQHKIALATLLPATPRSRPPSSHSHPQTRPHRPATTCSLHLNLAYCTHRHNQPRHLDCSMHICTCHIAHLSHRMSLPVAPHFLACCTASKPVAKQILTCCTACSHLTPHTSITYTRRTVFLHLSHPHPACTSYCSPISPFPLGLMSSARPSTSYRHLCTAASSLLHVPPFSPALPHSVKATHETRKPTIPHAVIAPSITWHPHTHTHSPASPNRKRNIPFGNGIAYHRTCTP